MKNLLNLYYLMCLSEIIFLVETTSSIRNRNNHKMMRHHTHHSHYGHQTPKSHKRSIEERIKAINTKDCGLKLTTNYIVGGEEAVKNEYPFMVSIQSNGDHMCGGVIINHWWILTAAHCVFGFENYTEFDDIGGIVIGAHRYLDGDQYSLSKVIIHHNFVLLNEDHRTFKLQNDIALIKTKTRIRFNSAVNAICLPTIQFTESYGEVTLAGWGKVRFDSDSDVSLVLRKVNLKIISDQQCANSCAKWKCIIYRAMICANSVLGKSGFHGDSGSPGFQFIDGRAVLVGVYSFGGSQWPSGFAQVSYYLKWISSVIFN